jgi:hypothetical protein
MDSMHSRALGWFWSDDVKPPSNDGWLVTVSAAGTRPSQIPSAGRTLRMHTVREVPPADVTVEEGPPRRITRDLASR